MLDDFKNSENKIHSENKNINQIMSDLRHKIAELTRVNMELDKDHSNKEQELVLLKD